MTRRGPGSMGPLESHQIIEMGKPAGKAARQFMWRSWRTCWRPSPQEHPQCSPHMIHLAHLIQVDCQFGSRPKPLQNNNLQFDAGLFQAHLAHFAHTHGGRIIVGKCANCSPQSALQFVKMARGGCREFVCSARVWQPRSWWRRDDWRLVVGHRAWE